MNTGSTQQVGMQTHPGLQENHLKNGMNQIYNSSGTFCDFQVKINGDWTLDWGKWLGFDSCANCCNQINPSNAIVEKLNDLIYDNRI